MSGPRVGVDVGATLAKLAVEVQPGGNSEPEIGLELFPAAALDDVARRIAEIAPESIGVTGGGARELAARLGAAADPVNEFAAWGAGAAQILRREASDGPPVERYLLVSVGTGTSVLLVDGIAVSRVGGTALGGGTVLGLGAALLGTPDFESVCRLAEKGDRAEVDLLVSDIYRAGEIPLIGDATASAFGRLARQPGGRGAGASDEDLASAIMSLVAENVALICHGLSALTQTQRVVFGGSTLRDNPALGGVLVTITRQLGREAQILPDGEFAGAIGCLELTRAR